MKKIYLLASLLLMFGCLKAQNQVPPPDPQKQQNIEALKIAFISRQLQLTPEEAQKFWPVYDQYSTEIKNAMVNNPDVITRDETVLNIRKRYRNEFMTIIGQDRTNRLFDIEERFHKVLIQRLRRQQRMQQQNLMVRPFLRRN